MNGRYGRLDADVACARGWLVELKLDIKNIYGLIFSEGCCASVTNAETPEIVSTELTSTPAKNPVGVGLTSPQVSFWQA